MPTSIPAVAPAFIDDLMQPDFIPTDPEGLTGYQSLDHLKYCYTHYSLRKGIIYDTGAAGMRIASAAGGTRPVQTTGPGSYLVIHWEVRRKNALPDMPSPTPPSTNETLIHAEIWSSAPPVTEENGIEYSISGMYVFSQAVPKWIEDGIQMPLAPWTTFQADDGTGSFPSDQPPTRLLTAQFKTGMF